MPYSLIEENTMLQDSYDAQELAFLKHKYLGRCSFCPHCENGKCVIYDKLADLDTYITCLENQLQDATGGFSPEKTAITINFKEK